MTLTGDFWFAASIVSLIFAAAFARWSAGSWLSPRSFMGAVWVVAGVPAAIIPGNGLAPATFFVCAGFLCTCSAGAILAECYLLTKRNRTSRSRSELVPEVSLDAKALSRWVTIFGCCGLAAAAAYILLANEKPQSIFDLQGWLKIPLQYSIARYHGSFLEPIPLRIMVALNYGGGMLSGVLLSLDASNRQRRAAIVPFVAGTLITLITTAKAPMLIGLIGIGAGYLAARNLSVARVRRQRMLRMFIGAIPLVVMAALVAIASLALRYGMSDSVDSALLLRRFGTYVFGHMYALSAWIDMNGLWSGSPQLGRYTFAGVFEALGLYQREAGIYDPIYLNKMAAGSNVFSVYRGLVQDFTYPGALVFFMGFGALSTIAGRWRGTPASQVLAISIVIASYSFIAWSPIISIFSYNVMILALVIVALVLWSTARKSSCTPPGRTELGADVCLRGE